MQKVFTPFYSEKKFELNRIEIIPRGLLQKKTAGKAFELTFMLVELIDYRVNNWAYLKMPKHRKSQGLVSNFHYYNNYKYKSKYYVTLHIVKHEKTKT